MTAAFVVATSIFVLLALVVVSAVVIRALINKFGGSRR